MKNERTKIQRLKMITSACLCYVVFYSNPHLLISVNPLSTKTTTLEISLLLPEWRYLPSSFVKFLVFTFTSPSLTPPIWVGTRKTGFADTPYGTINSPTKLLLRGNCIRLLQNLGRLLIKVPSWMIVFWIMVGGR